MPRGRPNMQRLSGQTTLYEKRTYPRSHPHPHKKYKFKIKTLQHLENGITVHATLKTAPLYTILPTLRKKQQRCGISCQSRIYSIIVKTLRNNFASVANLPGNAPLD